MVIQASVAMWEGTVRWQGGQAELLPIPVAAAIEILTNGPYH
jgi:hypothetical protein